jgi:seryl-tRNA synthetase
MIDLKILRNDPELVRESINKRNLKLDLDAVIALDADRLSHQRELESLQSLRNRVSKEIPSIADATERQSKIAEMKEVGERIKSIETGLAETEGEYFLALASLPNFLDPTAAIGPDDSGNVVEKLVGTQRKFDFPVKPHYDIGEARGWIDNDKGAEISGSRFWYLK